MDATTFKQQFIAAYGDSDVPVRVFNAPARVNLIGEHIDYNGGTVLPAALDMGIQCAARLNGERVVRIRVTDLDGEWVTSLDDLAAGKAHAFGSYQIGVFDEMQKAGYTLMGCDLLYHSTMPIGGSGLSSSAAYEVCTAYIINTFHNDYTGATGSNGFDRVKLAQISQKAENNFVGVNCGIMDQFASANGKRDHAVHINCATLWFEHIPLVLGDYRIVITNTNKKHKLTAGQYNERRSQCEAALEIIQRKLPIQQLCDTTVAAVEAAGVTFDDAILKNRAYHVMDENRRVADAVTALRAGELATFGALMTQSGASLRDLYEVTGVELDTVVSLSLECEGVLGARMTGGGFGGCAVAIVHKDSVDAYTQHVTDGYTKAIGYAPSVYVAQTDDGVREIL